VAAFRFGGVVWNSLRGQGRRWGLRWWLQAVGLQPQQTGAVLSGDGGTSRYMLYVGVCIADEQPRDSNWRLLACIGTAAGQGAFGLALSGSVYRQPRHDVAADTYAFTFMHVSAATPHSL